jgi:hypothetical protein
LIELLKTGKIALEEFQTREIKNYLLNTFRIQYDELEHAISSLQRNPHSIDYLINRKLSNQSWLQI